MRVAAGILVLLLTSGCGGFVVLESKSDAPVPRPVPAPECREITRRQAVEIAVAAASDRECSVLDVDDVKSDRNRWRVEMYGRCGCCGRSQIRVNVDRVTGQVLSYKVKRHGHGDDDDDGHRHHDHDVH